MHEKNTNNSLANIAKSFGLKGLGLPQLDPADSNPDLILGRIAIKDFSNARVLDRLLMYERRIEHSLFKTILELQRLHLLRTLDHPNATKPEPQDRYLAPGPVPGGSTEPNNTPVAERIEYQESRIEHPPSTIEYPASSIEHPESSIEHPASSIEHEESGIIAQNKPNVKIGKMTISPVTTKSYLKEQRTMNNEHYPKQTQSNPIPPPRRFTLHASRFTRYAIRHTRYEPCTTAAGQP
jgi:hypothetical protein